MLSIPSALRVRACRFGQLGVALDGVYVPAEQGEQRRVVARAGADIEYAVGRFEREELEHASHHQRLGDRLSAADRQGHVGVGPIMLGFRYEPLAGDARDGGQDALVGNRGAESLRELGCLARGHGGF